MLVISVVCYCLLSVATVQYLKIYKLKSVYLILFFTMIHFSFIFRIVYFVFMMANLALNCTFLNGCEFGFVVFLHNA